MVDIYVLSDPRTNIDRYVGKASNYRKRLLTHISDSSRRATPVALWIRELISLGLCPISRVIETCSEKDWPEVERRAIASYPLGSLLNLAPGGNQPFCAVAIRRKNGAAVAKSIHSDPFQHRIWYLKKQMNSALKAGIVSEHAKMILRYIAVRKPDLFGQWAGI